MRATHRRLGFTVSLSILLGLASCGEVDYEWPAMTLVAREGMAVLEIEDDEVLFEGVPFAGTVPIVTTPTGMRAVDTATMEWTIAGRKVSLVLDNHGTMEVSVGELKFTVTRGGEEVEFGGRRANLAGGATRAVFTKDGGVEVSERE